MMIKTIEKKRDSNLELYRIIVMILIVAHHYVVNSQLMALDGLICADLLSWRSVFLLLMGAWGKIGINCFVLITGFFMCKSEISAKKFIKLLLEVEFYKIVIYFVFLISGYQTFSIVDFIKVLIPFTKVATNFTGCFLLFYLCIPFLNILVRNLTEKQHIRLLVLCSVIYIFFGTVPFFSVRMNYVSWYIVLYFIASYIRLYPKKIFKVTRFWGWATIVSMITCGVSVLACTWLGNKIGKNIMYYFVTDSNTFLAVVTAVCSFLWFKNLKIKYNAFINTVASSTFGVLLIHANSDTMREWLWNDFLRNADFYSSSLLVLHFIGSVISVFVVCTLIDIVRTRYVEKPFFRFWDYIWVKIEDRYQRVASKLCEKFNITNE